MTKAPGFDLRSLSAAEAGRRIARGEVTSRMLTETALGAAAIVNPDLNAFIEIRADQALAQADQADEEIRAGRTRGALHGVPLAHKDVFYRPGFRTTGGSAQLADFLPTEKSPVLERLDAAGAIDLGTLNLAEFCVGPTGQNDHTGNCCNPWAPDHITGGSSSGSGAAVAARLAYGSIGSDTGGSIRLPAGMCGVVGLKPSFGRVSLRAAIERCWSLDVFGPLARTVEDVALMLTVIAGFDPEDAGSASAPVPDYAEGLADDVAGLKIAVPAGMLDRAEPDIAACHALALDALRDAGIALVEVTLPETDRYYRLTTVINNVEASYLHRDNIERHPERFNPSTLSRINRGLDIPAIEYLGSVRGQRHERTVFEKEVLAGRAAIYMPLLDFEVPRQQTVAFGSAAGADDVVPRLTHWTRWVSYLGLPALALPIGFSRNGLPVSCQLIGGFLQEKQLLQLGAAYQRKTDWHKQAPPFS